jgi:hypothetical protein
VATLAQCSGMAIAFRTFAQLWPYCVRKLRRSAGGTARYGTLCVPERGGCGHAGKPNWR